MGPVQLPDRLFRSAATQTVMRFDLDGASQARVDVRDDGVEPPPVEIVERQLLASGGPLAANDHPQLPPGEIEDALGDLRPVLRLGTQGGVQVVKLSAARAWMAAATLVVFFTLTVKTMLWRSTASITSAW